MLKDIFGKLLNPGDTVYRTVFSDLQKEEIAYINRKKTNIDYVNVWFLRKTYNQQIGKWVINRNKCLKKDCLKVTYWCPIGANSNKLVKR